MGVERGHVIPAEWDPSAGDWFLNLDSFETVDDLRDAHGQDCLTIEIVRVGGSLGLTIPAPIRHHHGLTDDDDLLLQARDDGYYVDFDLVDDSDDVEPVPAHPGR